MGFLSLLHSFVCLFVCLWVLMISGVFFFLGFCFFVILGVVFSNFVQDSKKLANFS